MLDADTRDYLRLLINGAGKGLENRGTDLREVFRLFEPTHRDLARVNGAVADPPRAACAGSVNSLDSLSAELAGKEDDLAQLVDSAAARVPLLRGRGPQHQPRPCASCRERSRQTTDTLGKVERLAEVLGPASENLRPAARALGRSQVALRPLAREAEPLAAGRGSGRWCATRGRWCATCARPSSRPRQRHAGPAPRVRRAEPLLQHGRVQPARPRGPGRGRPRGGLPVLDRLGEPPVGQPVRHRRRPRARSAPRWWRAAARPSAVAGDTTSPSSSS